METEHPNATTVPITRQEAHVLLRALATHREHERGSDDKHACDWLAQRLLRIVALKGW